MRWLAILFLSACLTNAEVVTFIETTNPALYFTDTYDGGCIDSEGNPALCTNLTFIGWQRTNVINVASNQVVEVTCNTFDYLFVTKDGNQAAAFPGLNYAAYNDWGWTLPILPKAYPLLLAGPLEMRPSGNGLLTYKITPKEEPIQPGTGVVIPTDATGPVEIVLESSADLVNWTASVPGIYGANTTNRFFRVRAIRQ